MTTISSTHMDYRGCTHYGSLRCPFYIFVFGSNLSGRHGRGAALTALQQYGAIYGQGVGHHGNSYAIPTKDGSLNTLPLTTIAVYVDNFITYAKEHPGLTFFVTRVGCGLAGYEDKDIAPMFKYAPDNCQLPPSWPRTFKVTFPIWYHMDSAPKDASWIDVQLVDGSVHKVHWAEDMSGSDQPAFKGWFFQEHDGFTQLEAEPIAWRPRDQG